MALSLKSWLFTPATKADRFGRAGEAQADALIIDLEDAVAFTDKQKARTAALQYLEQPAGGRLPCALRINAPVTRAGIEDLHSLLESTAAPDYIILPKCDSLGFICMLRALLDQTAKEAEIIPLIESAKGVEALPGILRSNVRPVALLFGAADMEADLGATLFYRESAGFDGPGASRFSGWAHRSGQGDAPLMSLSGSDVPSLLIVYASVRSRREAVRPQKQTDIWRSRQ